MESEAKRFWPRMVYCRDEAFPQGRSRFCLEETARPRIGWQTADFIPQILSNLKPNRIWHIDRIEFVQSSQDRQRSHSIEIGWDSHIYIDLPGGCLSYTLAKLLIFEVKLGLRTISKSQL